jgi:hypothetical protein
MQVISSSRKLRGGGKTYFSKSRGATFSMKISLKGFIFHIKEGDQKIPGRGKAFLNWHHCIQNESFYILLNAKKQNLNLFRL